MNQPERNRHRRPLIAAGALGVAAVLGITAAFGGTTVVAGVATAAQGVPTAAGVPAPYGSVGGSGGGRGYGGWLYPGNGSPGTPGSSGGQAEVAATVEQQVGLVYIDTVLAYQGAEAAGTGLVLTADGQILTNNHVIEGSTSITVTVVSTGQTYQASVLGTDPQDDIAVLALAGASGLTTANLGTSADLRVGEEVVGVGNAGGDGGIPSAAAGVVSALNRTITTEAEGAAAGETLDGLIETTADIQSGDSGGPLFNADNEVVGIDTAAEVIAGESENGYAIPIDTAMGIVEQIRNGDESDGVVIGYPAFLGVQVQAATTGTGTGGGRGGSGSVAGGPVSTGASIAGVVQGSPANLAGLTAGDTVVGIDATSIGTADALSAVLAQYRPGDTVTVTWIDATGAQHSASVTLVEGPAA